MTDFWKPYEHFVPKDIHIQSKAETYTDGLLLIYVFTGFFCRLSEALSL